MEALFCTVETKKTHNDLYTIGLSFDLLCDQKVAYRNV
jgi:hypothetical protein